MEKTCLTQESILQSTRQPGKPKTLYNITMLWLHTDEVGLYNETTKSLGPQTSGALCGPHSPHTCRPGPDIDDDEAYINDGHVAPLGQEELYDDHGFFM
jgi:hypothetical protein